MARKTEDTVVEIYALINGKKVEIENLHYTITRETEPVFQMGTPMEKHILSHRRTLTGTFEMTPEKYKELRFRHFDVYINVPDDNRTIYIKDLEVISNMKLPIDLGANISVAFIARDLSTDILKKLEDMNNRELAKQLLEREY